MSKYSKEMMGLFTDTFQWLPLAHVIGGKVRLVCASLFVSHIYIYVHARTHTTRTRAHTRTHTHTHVLGVVWYVVSSYER